MSLPAALEPRTIPLGRFTAGKPKKGSRLVVGLVRSGRVGVAFYRPKRWDHERGEQRFAAERATLEEALAVALEEGGGPDWVPIAAYVRATAWGEKLP